MIGDGLSHVGFGAFSLALAFNTILEMHDKGLKKEGWELLIAIPIVIVAAYVLLRIGENKKIKLKLFNCI